MPKSRQPPVREIRSWDEVPAFDTEAEEADFWATHALTDGLLAEMGPVPDDVLPPTRPRTRPIAIRFDRDTIHRLKALADKKHKGYQTLLKEFIERLYEEEKREGLLR